jgi:hypothetical protein
MTRNHRSIDHFQNAFPIISRIFPETVIPIPVPAVSAVGAIVPFAVSRSGAGALGFPCLLRRMGASVHRHFRDGRADNVNHSQPCTETIPESDSIVENADLIRAAESSC